MTQSDANVITEILNQLEGHPNFVKANRIIDELHERSRKLPDLKTVHPKKLSGTNVLHLAKLSA
jgi:hypothetical protein